MHTASGIAKITNKLKYPKALFSVIIIFFNVIINISTFDFINVFEFDEETIMKKNNFQNSLYYNPAAENGTECYHYTHIYKIADGKRATYVAT